MIVRMQKTFKDFGHIKSNRGSFVAISAYVFYLGYLLYWHVFRATYLFLVNVKNYECNAHDHTLLSLGIWW